MYKKGMSVSELTHMNNPHKLIGFRNPKKLHLGICSFDHIMEIYMHGVFGEDVKEKS